MRNIGVLKLSRKDIGRVSKIANELGKAIDGEIVILPLDSELLLGEMARDELKSIQEKIQNLLS